MVSVPSVKFRRLLYVMSAVKAFMWYGFVSIWPSIRMCASVLFNEGGMCMREWMCGHLKICVCMFLSLIGYVG